MLTRKYILPADLTKTRLKKYVARFFKKTSFNSNYLNLYIIVKGNNNIFLGNRVIINIKHKKEVLSYLEHISEHLLYNKYTPKAKDILYIYYIETNKES